METEKLKKILKSRKAMKKIMIAFILCAVAFYGMAMMFGNFDIEFGKDILMQWGNVFVAIVVLIIVYMTFVFDEDLFKLFEMKKKKKDVCPMCNSTKFEVLKDPAEFDKLQIQKRQCVCGYIYDVEIKREVAKSGSSTH